MMAQVGELGERGVGDVVTVCPFTDVQIGVSEGVTYAGSTPVIIKKNGRVLQNKIPLKSLKPAPEVATLWFL